MHRRGVGTRIFEKKVVKPNHQQGSQRENLVAICHLVPSPSGIWVAGPKPWQVRHQAACPSESRHPGIPADSPMLGETDWEVGQEDWQNAFVSIK